MTNKQSPLPFFDNNPYFSKQRDIIVDIDGTLVNTSERQRIADGVYTNERIKKIDKRNEWWNIFITKKSLQGR